VLSLVIVAAALKRLSTYEAVFGFTRLRVVAGGVALWLGVVFVFVLIASLTLRAGWLPRVIAGSLAVALFARAVAGPHLSLAQHNIDRYHRIGKLSLSYMSTLSADAAPAMAQLTQAQRQCAGWQIALDLRDNVDDWRTFNAARERARQVLADVTTDAPARDCD